MRKLAHYAEEKLPLIIKASHNNRNCFHVNIQLLKWLRNYFSFNKNYCYPNIYRKESLRFFSLKVTKNLLKMQFVKMMLHLNIQKLELSKFSKKNLNFQIIHSSSTSTKTACRTWTVWCRASTATHRLQRTFTIDWSGRFQVMTSFQGSSWRIGLLSCEL